eukprot:SAG31_NODE_4701_length_3023_cov_28.325239_1_plen_220_part_00
MKHAFLLVGGADSGGAVWCVHSFDKTAWDRDGFIVFQGGLTDWATQEFRSSLRRIQAIDDHIIMNTDWRGTDWPAFGIKHTERRQTVTREELRGMCGGQERGFGLLPGHKIQRSSNPNSAGRLWDNAPVAFPPGVKNQGLLPSRFPPAYDNFLWDICSLRHPEFRSLQEKLLATEVDDIRMDHIHMLNRRGPDRGRTCNFAFLEALVGCDQLWIQIVRY